MAKCQNSGFGGCSQVEGLGLRALDIFDLLQVQAGTAWRHYHSWEYALGYPKPPKTPYLEAGFHKWEPMASSSGFTIRHDSSPRRV